jgi:hypothetical protein
MNRQREAGETYRPRVTIKKVKNKVPTVLTVSGREYILRHQDQYKQTKRRERK